MRHRGTSSGRVISSVSVLVVLAGAGLTGCGGSGGGSTPAQRSAPTTTTRARVHSMTQLGVRSMTFTGVQTAAFAASRNGIFRSGAVISNGPVPGTSSSTGQSVALPLVGAFIKNVAAMPPAFVSRAAHRDSGVAEPPIIVEPLPTFYFDDYLGLWVQIENADDGSTYLLYQDEAKTEPAGSIVTKWPTDWSVYPQVYTSGYEFTAGFLSGSHGSMSNTTNADGSGTASDENAYADGGRDRGSSAWEADGACTWSSRSDNGDGSWFECSGAFLADGSGKMHEASSGGYAADYVYNADGSGSAVITGPDSGLPAKIVWDVDGNETITYADGTVETIPCWSGYAESGSSGSGGSGSSGSSGSATPATPPPGTTTPIGL